MNACFVIIVNKNQKDFSRCFHSFVRLSEGAFCRNRSYEREKKERLRLGKAFNIIEHIGNETRNFSISLL